MCVHFLNSRNQEVPLDDLVEIRNQSALDEAEEPEFEPKATATLEPETTQHNILDRLQIRK
jgi:hypothetical protein